MKKNMSAKCVYNLRKRGNNGKKKDKKIDWTLVRD